GSLGDAIACASDPARMAVVRRAMAALQAFADGAEYPLLVQLTDSDKDRDALRRLLTMLLRGSRAAMEASVRGKGQGLAAQVAPRAGRGVWLEATRLFAEALESLDRNVSRSLLPVWLCSELMRVRLA
ncbi:MAG: hypothetical protein IIW34_04255, partial [Clostridia bacterium]|nr:hypothetical protein [Clostridia bacterium]